MITHDPFTRHLTGLILHTWVILPPREGLEDDLGAIGQL